MRMMKPGPGMGMNSGAAISISMSILVALVVILLAASLVYFGALNGPGRSTTSSSSSSTTQSTIQGIVAGYVTVGPSQPVCSTNQTCTEDISGYSLEFTSQCELTSTAVPSTSCQGQTYSAQIAPSGHYSILLAPGNYSITGLTPTCNWVGCSSVFPKAVVVEAGQQLVVNIDIDTGIR